MAEFWNKTLTRKMIRAVFSGLLAAALLFLFLFWLSNTLLNDYFWKSDFIYNTGKPYIRELDAFIKKEKIASSDIDRLNEWIQEKGISRIVVFRGRVLLYDSKYSEYSAENDERIFDYNWKYFHTVSFSDGDAEVCIYENDNRWFYLLVWGMDILLCVSVWILFISIHVHKEIKYIQQLNVSIQKIELGGLDSQIAIRGEDELGRLASGLNHMRLSLVKKEEKEKELKAAQDKLVLGMAHDLRTPLTGLMTFLEIARKQKKLSDCINYIEKAYVKTTQIRNLSDRMFEHFLINSEQTIKLEEPELAEYALEDYLSEFCALLEMEKYHVSIDGLFWKPLKIRICIDYMGRIVDNLVSNIKKYADITAPIKLYSDYDATYICLTFQNRIACQNAHVQKSGIGVKNIYFMMSQMNGLCDVKITQENYYIKLYFLIFQ